MTGRPIPWPTLAVVAARSVGLLLLAVAVARMVTTRTPVDVDAPPSSLPLLVAGGLGLVLLVTAHVVAHRTGAAAPAAVAAGPEPSPAGDLGVPGRLT